METKEEKKVEPCEELDYCPYGWLVEFFPLHGEKVHWQEVTLPWVEPNSEGRPCKLYGHDCPVDYVGD